MAADDWQVVPVCLHFLEGHCGFGDQCMYLHVSRAEYDASVSNYLQQSGSAQKPQQEPSSAIIGQQPVAQQYFPEPAAVQPVQPLLPPHLQQPLLPPHLQYNAMHMPPPVGTRPMRRAPPSGPMIRDHSSQQFLPAATSRQSGLPSAKYYQWLPFVVRTKIESLLREHPAHIHPRHFNDKVVDALGALKKHDAMCVIEKLGRQRLDSSSIPELIINLCKEFRPPLCCQFLYGRCRWSKECWFRHEQRTADDYRCQHGDACEHAQAPRAEGVGTAGGRARGGRQGGGGAGNVSAAGIRKHPPGACAVGTPEGKVRRVKLEAGARPRAA